VIAPPSEWKSLASRLCEPATRALATAAGICVTEGHYEIEPLHFFLAVVESSAEELKRAVGKHGVDFVALKNRLRVQLAGLPRGNPGRPVFSPLLIEWLESAAVSAFSAGAAEITLATLLITLVRGGRRFSIDLPPDLAAVPLDALRADVRLAENLTENNQPADPGSASSKPASPTDALSKFTVDFTEQAAKGLIDPVIGREREIRQVTDILSRRRKNNPILVGEAGVGKTAVVEGLARLISTGEAPDSLRGVRLLSLDIGMLSAGASVRGEFENRLKQVITQVKASPTPIVLFIDEAHTLIGAGGAAGSGDAANLLKPALARGELRTIAATTWGEYRKYFEKDPALSRRFQPVRVDEPEEESVIHLLRGLAGTYETAHGVRVQDAAIVAAARLGSRYVAGRQHPDKGVDLLDTAAARVKQNHTARPPQIEAVERRVQNLSREKTALHREASESAGSHADRLARIDREAADAEIELTGLRDQWSQQQKAVGLVLELRKRPTDAKSPDPKLLEALAAVASIPADKKLIQLDVTEDVVASVVSDWTGIPVGRMVRDEARAMQNLERSLTNRVRGQAAAVAAVADAIRDARTLGHAQSPIAVFLFVGPSGVGKTELALTIGDALFGGEQFVTTINMSEFNSEFAINRLIGAEPGTVGYEQGGVLTEAVRQRPFSVVLLDEIEKAHPRVFNLFYQVFEKGMLTDAQGRRVDFANTVICLTSNLASDVIMDLCSGAELPTQQQIVDAIRPVLYDRFTPALVGRMTLVPFLPISEPVMSEIIALKLKRLASQFEAAHRVLLSIDPAVAAAMVARCTEVEAGARNITHLIRSAVLPSLSAEVLSNTSQGKPMVPITLKVDAGGNFVVVPDGGPAS
jgi:type VI secretion system protein VasG